MNGLLVTEEVNILKHGFFRLVLGEATKPSERC